MGTPHTGVTTSTCQGHVTFPHLIPQVPFPIGALLYVTESVSPTIFEIMGIFLYLGHDLDLSRSRDAIGHMTNRSAICHFLLVSHCNLTSISNRFRDIWPANPVRTHRHTPQVIVYSVPCNVLHWTDNKFCSP